MNSPTSLVPEDQLPLKANLRPVYSSTFAVVILLVVVSLAGIFFHTGLYPEGDLSATFLANDILNLMMGLPLIGITMVLTRRGKYVGLLCYPGALFYIIYVYATYLLGLPFSVFSILYLLLVGVSVYALFALISRMDFERILGHLEGKVPVRSSGIILLCIALMVLIYQFYSIVQTLIKYVSPEQIVLAQWVVDLIIATPPGLAISISMIRRRPVGYALGMSLLFVLGALFVGLVPVIIIKGMLTGIEINGLDILIVSLSSMICVIPFILFVRGVKRSP